MLKALWLAAVLVFPGVAPAQNSTFKVSGTVVREDGQDPIKANTDRVLLRSSGSPTVVEVGTGGAFEFTDVRPGNYQMVVGPRVTMEPVTVVVTDKDVVGLRLMIPDVVGVTGAV